MMMVEPANEHMPVKKFPKVKLRAGASIVKVIPLFTYDSKYVVLASGCDLKVYSVSSGECFQTLKAHKTPVIGLQEYKPSNLQILSCSEDGIVYRWDCVSGTALKKYNFRIKTPLTAFYAPYKENHWFVITKVENTVHPRLLCLTMKSRNPAKKSVIFYPVSSHAKSIAFGVEGQFFASVFESTLSIYNNETKATRYHLVGERTLTCVACHPSECMVATGDSIGNIYVWTNILADERPTKSIFHWHTLPVSHLSFSCEGSHVFSGGGEAVLVKWNLRSGDKQVVPRLGMPILLLSVSPDNSLVAMCNSDNAIQILNINKKVVQIIQGLTLGHFQGIKTSSGIRTGLLYDPRTKSLVLNSHPGHLQFYKIHEDKQLFNLDIVWANIASQERDFTVINTDIEKAALDYKGQWLATVESWEYKDSSSDICLKFFEYKLTTQEFSLNTKIQVPHSEKINCLKFRPKLSNGEESYQPMAVTTSDDKSFKIWHLCHEDGSDDLTQRWKNVSIGDYQQTSAGDACFSPDGSLLAVIFNCTITLWEPPMKGLVKKIDHANSQNAVQQVAFGQGRNSHYLVCHSGNMLRVWNFLSFTVQWTVMCNVQCIAVDTESNVMAAFTKEKNLFIFTPESPQPLFSLKEVSTTPIVSAIFVPYELPSSAPEETSSLFWQKNSQMFFMNSNQELLTVTEETDEDDETDSEKVKLHQNLPLTPFALLQPQQKTSGVVAQQVKYDAALSLINTEDNKQIISSASSYACENMVTLCSTVIPSFLIERTEKKLENFTKEIKSSVEKSDVDSDEEEISSLPTKQKKTVVLPLRDDDAMEVDEDNVYIEDYSFLRNFLSSTHVMHNVT